MPDVVVPAASAGASVSPASTAASVPPPPPPSSTAASVPPPPPPPPPSSTAASAGASVPPPAPTAAPAAAGASASASANAEPVSAPPSRLYRAHRDKVYDRLTEKQLHDYGFRLDADVYVYNDTRTQLTSEVLNRPLYITSAMIAEYTPEGRLTETCVANMNRVLRRWGKIPEFLEVRESPGKGFGIFAKEALRKGQFLGFYDGIRHPCAVLNPDNRYLFSYRGTENEIVGAIDGENLTYSNWTTLVNDGRPEEYNVIFLPHTHQILLATLRDIAVGEELVGNYGEGYWGTRKKL